MKAKRGQLMGVITSNLFSDLPEGTEGVVEHDHQEYWSFTYVEPAPKEFGKVRSLPERKCKVIHSCHFRLKKTG